MLSPLAEQESGDAAMTALGWTSLALWPQIVARLSTPVRLQAQGSLLLAHGQDLGAAQRVLARVQGAEALAPQRLAELEPALRADLRAWLLPGEGLIHPVEAMAALHDEAPGVRWHWGQVVSRLEPGRLDDRRFDWAIDTRGLGARSIQLALRGVRGEIISLGLKNHGLRRPLRLLHPRQRVYLLPRSDDELVLGASEIESEDRSPVSLRTAVELMAAAHSLMPALAEARITRLDVNLRPALPDNKALAHQEPGLLRLNGLYRHGWLLAPALVQRLLQESRLETA